jgi:hypothetical protein
LTSPLHECAPDHAIKISETLDRFVTGMGFADHNSGRVMRLAGSKQQLESRRVAMALLETGWGGHQGARPVKAAPGSVCRWRDTFLNIPAVGQRT